MRKKDIIEGVVDHVEFPNKGTFSYEDRTITVKGVIEGQKIRGQVTKKRRNGGQVRLLEVLEPSKLEYLQPECENFGACGGCFYQTVSYKN